LFNKKENIDGGCEKIFSDVDKLAFVLLLKNLYSKNNIMLNSPVFI